MIIVEILDRLYDKAQKGEDKAKAIKVAIGEIQDTMTVSMKDTICTILDCHSKPVKFWVDITLNEIRKVIKKGTDE